ncbi:hypothetical protein [Neoaquamicrobium sediminum]
MDAFRRFWATLDRRVEGLPIITLLLPLQGTLLLPLLQKNVEQL